MLKKLRIWIYENWFRAIASLLISFLIWKNILFVFPLALLISWQFTGSPLQSLFYTFIFLIPVFVFNNYFPLAFIFIFLLSFLFFRKNPFSSWLILLASLFINFYFYQLEILNLTWLILIVVFTITFFVYTFLNKNIFESLIYALIFFELIFLFQFLPFSFYFRTLTFLFLLVLILKIDIIKLWI